jgi:hypothetical protein
MYCLATNKVIDYILKNQIFSVKNLKIFCNYGLHIEYQENNFREKDKNV